MYLNMETNISTNKCLFSTKFETFKAQNTKGVILIEKTVKLLLYLNQ